VWRFITFDGIGGHFYPFHVVNYPKKKKYDELVFELSRFENLRPCPVRLARSPRGVIHISVDSCPTYFHSENFGLLLAPHRSALTRYAQNNIRRPPFCSRLPSVSTCVINTVFRPVRESVLSSFRFRLRWFIFFESSQSQPTIQRYRLKADYGLFMRYRFFGVSRRFTYAKNVDSRTTIVTSFPTRVLQSTKVVRFNNCNCR